MRDLFFVGFMMFMFLLGFRRAYIGALCYVWMDLLQPQEQSYYLINSLPITLIAAVTAVLLYLVADREKEFRFSLIQGLMLGWIAWFTVTTMMSELPEVAWPKWSSSWKAVGFAVFLPMVIRSRLHIEMIICVILFTVLSIAASGALKTVLGGGGYGQLSFLVDRNVGLFESSTIATVAVGMIPLGYYLLRHSMLFAHDRMTYLVFLGIVAVAALTVIGTEARTGLLCIGFVAGIAVLKSKYKSRFFAAGLAAAIIAAPMVPDSWYARMGLIENHDQDVGASTRLAMWEWTIDYSLQHPLGGGFGIWRTSKVEVDVKKAGSGNGDEGTTIRINDEARGFHSSYFEVLGEQGYPGLVIFLSIIIISIVKLLRIAKRFPDGHEEAWLGGAAKAIATFLCIFLIGSTFQALALQSTMYTVLAVAVSIILAADRVDAKLKAKQVAATAAARRPGQGAFGPAGRRPVVASRTISG